MICAAVCGWACTSLAAPIPLAQAPAGGNVREPAPNVILSIDDSGSMGEAVKSGSSQTKMAALKAALRTQFGDPTATPPIPGLIEDGRIRLAFQSMWSPGWAGGDEILPGGANSIKPFSGTHRIQFATFVNALRPSGGTASHHMMNNVNKYLRTPESLHSPWANNPGSKQVGPYLACRRTYHIFMTDGEWTDAYNDVPLGNVDGSPMKLPDGVIYNPNNPSNEYMNVYADRWGGNRGGTTGGNWGGSGKGGGTLADFAFLNWATDFQNGDSGTAEMPNAVKPRIKRSGAEKIGGVMVPEYWNPKNDPATWQHVTQYTIGFGTGATSWSGDPDWDSRTNDTYGGDFPKLINGTVSWQNVEAGRARTSDLWHMALNGRGKFYPALDSTALSAAFADILDNVLEDTSAPVVSVTVNAKRIHAGAQAYVAGYKAGEWSGSLKAYPLTDTGLGKTLLWDAAALLDSALTPDTRTILTFDQGRGLPFRWFSLPGAVPATKQTLLHASDNLGITRLNYLRGERSQEKSQSGAFRGRTTRLGDIVNSVPWYLGRPSSSLRLPGYAGFMKDMASRTPMLYVGANDGMLHGFDASSADTQGQERIAYVPEGVYDKLVAYTSPGYSHQYTVDASPFTGDVLLGASQGTTGGSLGTWRTYLAGFLGGGGKGYFVLDVTDPANFKESEAAQLVVKDTTASSDPDIGHIYSQPAKNPANSQHAVQFTMMNNDRPALILGNGVNSTNECAVLLIQYLDGRKELVKRQAGCTRTGTGNGLSNPQVLDLNNDGKADVVYAGDLLGNIWKFDLTSQTESDWKVAFFGKPLFTATSSTKTTQAITTAPVWLPHPRAGIQLGFGTGRSMTATDRSDASEQTFYAVWDNSVVERTATGITLKETMDNLISEGRKSLVEQTMGTTLVASQDGINYFNMLDTKPVNYNPSGDPSPAQRRGWFMKLNTARERVSTNPAWFYGNLVSVASTIPATGGSSGGESCDAVSMGAQTESSVIVDLISGAAPKTSVFYTDGRGQGSGPEKTANKASNTGKLVWLKDSRGAMTAMNPEGLMLSVNPPQTNAPASASWRER